MQTKTIKKTIEDKLTEWLDSITDEKLSARIKDSLLLSGGSITSLFLHMEVNDYDVYIQDKNVLSDLVQYYIKEFPGIKILYGSKRNEYMQEPQFNQKEDGEALNAYAISVQNLQPSQVKLWFESRQGYFKPEDVDVEKKYTPVFFSPNAISLSNGVQIIIRFHGTPEEIHKSFDFIHATNYFTFEKGLVLNIKALESLLTKQLYYQGSMYPITSIIRMKKFIKRGWNITAGEILKILFQVSQLNLSDPNVLEEQLIGIDIAYFDTLINILRGVEATKITAEYISEIIDRIFNGGE